MNRTPWTREDLEYLIPKVERQLAETEEEQRKLQLPGQEEVKPLPPMTSEECLEYLSRLMDYAVERPLTARERFLHDSLLCQFQQASIAEALGKKGRFYLIDENNLMKIINT